MEVVLHNVEALKNSILSLPEDQLLESLQPYPEILSFAEQNDELRNRIGDILFKTWFYEVESMTERTAEKRLLRNLAFDLYTVEYYVMERRSRRIIGGPEEDFVYEILRKYPFLYTMQRIPDRNLTTPISSIIENFNKTIGTIYTELTDRYFGKPSFTNQSSIGIIPPSYNRYSRRETSPRRPRSPQRSPRRERSPFFPRNYYTRPSSPDLK